MNGTIFVYPNAGAFMQRLNSASFCLLLIATACISPIAAAAKPTSRPNVIYILADDLGYGDLSCYGQNKLTTPNIDRLANEGMKFTGHYSGNTVCSPSRAVLMTGLHPGHCAIRGNGAEETTIRLEPDDFVLPELFQAAGYATGAFGKWGLGITNSEGRGNPLSNGFDEFYGWKSQMIAHTYYPSSVVHNGKELPLAEGTYVHDLIMEQARDFIRRQAEAKTPFFCYIPTAVPHAAMHAPKALHEKWRKQFPQFDQKIGKYGAGPGEDCPDVVNPIAGFAAMMEHLDNEVGDILSLLTELGIDESTLVMFASDNGAHLEGGHDPSFWNSTGGLRGHKRDMHEGGIRSPLLARWPGTIKAGSTSDHLSAFWDVLPTMAELTGQPTTPDSDGISFLPTLLGDPDQPQHDYLYWEFHKGPKPFSQAVRRGQWKAYQERGKPLELYDLAADPFEQHDLAGDKPELVARMKAILAEAHRPLAPTD
jgi:arylsulfatase A-like enzyme